MPKNVMCKRCNNLANDWCEKVIDSPDPDMQRDCQHFREKTNGDLIRAMSDEELAKEFVMLAGWDRNEYEKAKRIGIEKVMLDWLKRPAEPPKGGAT